MIRQEGGIFGGGSYEADAARDGGYGRPMPPPKMGSVQMDAEAPPSQRPRGNQSSIEGGIFGEAPADMAPARKGGANKSNQSSIEGGIFGTGPAVAAPVNRGRHSNQSSIEGGIFGTG